MDIITFVIYYTPFIPVCQYLFSKNFCRLLTNCTNHGIIYMLPAPNVPWQITAQKGGFKNGLNYFCYVSPGGCSR